MSRNCCRRPDAPLWIVLLVVVASFFSHSDAECSQSDELYMRVVDVGAGLCCILRIPADDPEDFHYVVYDVGNYQDKAKSALHAVEEIIPEDERIDLVVLSHTDSDHAAGLPALVDGYHIDRILRTGMERFGNFPKTLRNARDAVQLAVDEDETTDLELSSTEFFPGATFRLGDAFVTMVAGFGSIPSDWDLESNSERNNAPSIIVRVLYRGRAILLCGDAVGRHNGDPDSAAPIATEKFVLEMGNVLRLQSDVLVAPHHGADNGSSIPFIKAVEPEYVIFSAGHHFNHPRARTAQRYLDCGVDQDKMLRTDLGDDEGDKEWDYGRIPGHKDKIGDDDIEVVIDGQGGLRVSYLRE